MLRRNAAALLVFLASCFPGSVAAHTPSELPSDATELQELKVRLEQTEVRLRALETWDRDSRLSGGVEQTGLRAADFYEPEQNGGHEHDFEVGYDGGFFIRSTDEKQPFAINIGGRIQFRHTAFERDETTWTDNAGVTRPIRPRNDFEIERGRLEFEGHFIDEKLQYYINIDADTDDNHRAIFHDFWMNYEFSKAFNLHVGKAFVPGSREWLAGSTRTRFSDRSMTTTFFRPDRSIGVWATGELIEDELFYRVMVANGFATSDLTVDEIDRQMAVAGSSWWDLWGNYGEGYSDLAYHECPAVLVGHSFSFASESGRTPAGAPFAEERFARLTDGTRLVELGALAPGVTVDSFDTYLYAVDWAGKYRGFSFNAEYYFRWLQSISGNGPLPVAHLFDHGFYAEGGYFVIPERLEFIARTSQIYGEYGSAGEFAGGATWFFRGSHNLKLTLDVTKLIGTPTDNSGPNYRVGDDGVMVRTQFQAAF